MFSKEIVTFHRFLCNGYEFIEGVLLNDLGRFEFKKLSDNKGNCIYFTPDEYNVILQALNEKRKIQHVTQSRQFKLKVPCCLRTTHNDYRIMDWKDRKWEFFHIPDSVRKEIIFDLLKLPSVCEMRAKYSKLEERRESFKNWQKTSVNIEQLARAGFYYTGVLDMTRCFVCKGGVFEWVEGDDPIKEHSKHYPHCYYLKRIAEDESLIEDFTMSFLGDDVIDIVNDDKKQFELRTTTV